MNQRTLSAKFNAATLYYTQKGLAAVTNGALSLASDLGIRSNLTDRGDKIIFHLIIGRICLKMLLETHVAPDYVKRLLVSRERMTPSPFLDVINYDAWKLN